MCSRGEKEGGSRVAYRKPVRGSNGIFLQLNLFGEAVWGIEHVKCRSCLLLRDTIAIVRYEEKTHVFAISGDRGQARQDALYSLPLQPVSLSALAPQLRTLYGYSWTTSPCSSTYPAHFLLLPHLPLRNP